MGLFKKRTKKESKKNYDRKNKTKDKGNPKKNKSNNSSVNSKQKNNSKKATTTPKKSTKDKKKVETNNKNLTTNKPVIEKQPQEPVSEQKKNREVIWYKPWTWFFRNNKKRTNSNGKNKKEHHPCIVVGERENYYANLGLTKDSKRGHHKNTPLPSISNETHVRDDLQFDEKKYLQEPMEGNPYLSAEDIEKVINIIEKNKDKHKKSGEH